MTLGADANADRISAMKLEPVIRTANARVPTRWGQFRCYSFESGDLTHLAFVMGELQADQNDDETDDVPVLVRVHSECLTGDIFASLKCDCGPQLHEAMRRIAEVGRGVVVYLRGHEGRGIGITHKLRAYELQDAGFDTVDANLELGLPVDDREYGAGAQILSDLGVSKLRLLTNNPEKGRGLEEYGLIVTELVPLHPEVHAEAEEYLRTKRDRMGHSMPPDHEATSVVARP